MSQKIKNVRKINGELTSYEPSKIIGSLSRSGANKLEVEQIMERLEDKLMEGMDTRDLYKSAFDILQRVNGTVAARYSLKRAMQELGPEGHYFEMWTSRFLANLGYQTIENLVIQGEAVTHEADVIAYKNEKLFWIECKFRNSMDSKISVTTPMYLLSRIKDISQRPHHLFGQSLTFQQGWLVTNAYLTLDAISFSEHYGIRVISWDYPENRSIKNLVDLHSLYPVTCLTTLNKLEKTLLLDNKVALVRDLEQQEEILDKLHFSPERKHAIMHEVHELIAFQNNAK